MRRLAQAACWISLCALLSLAPASAQNAASVYVEPANLRALVAAVVKEGGVLDFAAGPSLGGATGAQQMSAAISRLYHINFTIHYSPVTSGVQFISQLVQEVKSGQAASSDILFTAYDGQENAYIQRVDWVKYVPNIPPDEALFDGRALKVMTTVNSFEYNTKLVPPGQVPTSYADLLKPQWKGKIASSPYQGSFLNYIGLPSVMGHQGMIDYVTKFAAQLGGIMTCTEADRIVAGEFAIFGLNCGDHEQRLRARKGEPIASFYPKEGVPLGYLAPAIPSTAVHPNAARLFMVFLLTREGQDILWNVVGQDCDLLPGSHMAAVLTDLRKRGVKLISGPHGQSLDVLYPELVGYAREVGRIINQGK